MRAICASLLSMRPRPRRAPIRQARCGHTVDPACAYSLRGPRFRLHNLSRRKTCTDNRYRPFCNSFTPRRWTAASCSEQLGAFKATADQSSCVADGTVPLARLGHMPVQVAVGASQFGQNHSRPAAMTGVSAIQPGATPIACRLAPTRFRSEGSADAVASVRSYAELSPDIRC